MLRFEPLSRNAHTALVVTRRGQFVTVIPAGSRRVLSDYLSLPYELREVDMRERSLMLDQRYESLETGYHFQVRIQVVYQVSRPEQVALGHADVLSELEEAVLQRARATARSFGVEQASALSEALVEALAAGNDLPGRFNALGLALRRTDIAVTLGEAERARAEALHDQIRDRPLLARFPLESADPGVMFDVQVGGFYRVRSRDVGAGGILETERAIIAIIVKALARIAAAYTMSDYREAGRLMTDELWNDGVLKAELASSGIALLRPAVHIYPNRDLLVRTGRLLLEDDRSRTRFAPRLTVTPRLTLAAPRDEPPDVEANAPAPQPDTSAESAPAEVEYRIDETTDADVPADRSWTDGWQALAGLDRLAGMDVTDAVIVPEAESSSTLPDAAAPPAADPSPQPPAAPEPAVVAAWVTLLRSCGPAHTKLWTLEITENPERLPEILAELTSDPALLTPAHTPAAASVLRQHLAEDSATAERTTTTDADSAPDWSLRPSNTSESDIPDWLQLRASFPET
jgi:hypothetical protein